MNLSDYQKIGDSFYTYEEKVIGSKINELQECFPGFELNYSIKTNPNQHILEYIFKNGLGTDAASRAEVLKADNIGFPKEKIWYSSPGKTIEDIRETIDKCTIIADSFNELFLINEFCKANNVNKQVGIRINPYLNSLNVDVQERMCGGTSQYGIDEELLLEKIDIIRELSNIEVIGIHVYIGSQITDYRIIYNHFVEIFRIADILKNQYNINLKFINFGGGFGVPYTKEDSTLDLSMLKSSLKDVILKYKVLLGEDVKYIIESGRYIVSEAGKYYCCIVDIKESRGIKYLIVRGGMNAFFRPVFKKIDYMIGTSSTCDEYDTYRIAGYSCTPEDIFINQVKIKKCKIGDYIYLLNAGSYGYTMSLLEFISLDRPKEVYLNSDGKTIY